MSMNFPSFFFSVWLLCELKFFVRTLMYREVNKEMSGAKGIGKSFPLSPIEKIAPSYLSARNAVVQSKGNAQKKKQERQYF